MNNPTDDQQKPDPAATPAGAQNTDDAQPKMIPYDRFQEVNSAKNAAEKRLKELEAAETQRQQDKARAAGEFEKIIADLEPKAKRAAELEAALTAYLDEEMKAIPDHLRDLIPDGDATAKLTWIKNAKAKGLFNRTPAPETDAGAGGDKKPAPAVKLTDEQKKMALKNGMTEEQYIAAFQLTNKGKP